MHTQYSSSHAKNYQPIPHIKRLVFKGVLINMAVLLAACSTLNEKSELDLPFKDAQFRTPSSTNNDSTDLRSTPTSAATLAQGTWWEVFGDAQLNSLVQDAIQNNKDLDAALARLEASQASLDAASASLFPTLNFSTTRTKSVVKGSAIQGNVNNTRGFTTSAQFSASYELDVWSRVRASRQAANLQFQATAYEVHAAELSIAGQVATAYIQWQAAQLTVQQFEKEVADFQTNLKLVEFRFKQGSIPASDVLQQKQLLESSLGNLALAQANKDVIANSLNLLTGRPPNQLKLSPLNALPLLTAAPPLGIPAEVLQRRPDVQQAWAQLASADQSVAAAMAARLPQLTIQASFGDQVRDSEFLFDNWVRNLSINLLAPLFDGGARAAEVERRQALMKQAIAQYQQVSLRALQEVDNAWVQEDGQREAVESLKKQIALAELSLNRLFAAYRSGGANYLAILNAQQSTSALKRSLINAQQQELTFRIALYRALSGPIQQSKIQAQ